MNVHELRKELSAPNSGDGKMVILPLSTPVAAPSIKEKVPTRSSGYEDAPATRMLATNCACCGRPLLDAASVEAGMGPTCRKRLGYTEINEDVRVEANKLIYEIAVVQKGHGVVPHLNRLRELGLDAIAAKIEKRCVAVVVEQEGGQLLIKTPYKETALAAWRFIRGRRWDKKRKVNVVPVERRRQVWNLLTKYYKGELLRSAKGVSVIRRS